MRCRPRPEHEGTPGESGVEGWDDADPVVFSVDTVVLVGRGGLAHGVLRQATLYVYTQQQTP